MATRRKYSDELRDRAVQPVLELRRGGSRRGEIAQVSRSLGIHPESLRLWVREHESVVARQPDSLADSLRIAAPH
jgi:transposase-like protein